MTRWVASLKAPSACPSRHRVPTQQNCTGKLQPAVTAILLIKKQNL